MSDSDSGQKGPRPWIEDDELIEIIRSQTATRPVTGTLDVVDAAPIEHSSVLTRLHSLADASRVGRLSVGNVFVWWVNDDE